MLSPTTYDINGHSAHILNIYKWTLKSVCKLIFKKITKKELNNIFF